MNRHLAKKFWVMWGVLAGTAIVAGLCGQPFYVVETCAAAAAISGYVGFILM